MLLSFSVENFRSCRDTQTISLVADAGTELEENTFSTDEVAGLRGQRLLKSVAIFGPNASGKTNLVKAMSFFFRFISRSATGREVGSPIDVTPFKLDVESPKKPTRFSATFVIENVVHEYSFTVSSKRVEREELFAYPKKIGRQLFLRTVDDSGKTQWEFNRTHFHRDRSLESKTRDEALFVSVAAQWNHEQLKPIHEWARGQTYLVFVDDTYRAQMRTAVADKCITDERFCTWANKMLKEADTGICSLTGQVIDEAKNFPAEILKTVTDDVRKYFIKASAIVSHQIRDSKDTVSWGIEEESAGTQQVFALLNSWDGILNFGRTAIVDELNSSLHPLISRWLLGLVHSRKTNIGSGQLVFTSHDTSLLDNTLLRRDQIYLTSRDNTGATRACPLITFKPRKEEALQKGYLAGRYGAIPFLGGRILGIAPQKEPE